MLSAVLALLAGLSVPAWPQASQEVAARGAPVGFDAELTQAFVEFLRADPADPIGAETADALASGGIPVRIAAVHGRALGAVFEQETGTVLINLAHVASRYASQTEEPVDRANQALILEGIRQSWERNPESLRAFVQETAPLIVHEVRHALYARQLGPHPSSMEEELACHGYEALFVRARLRRDPDYLGIRQFDALVREKLGEPAAGAGVWWKDPFPFSPLHDVVAAIQSVHARFPGRFRVPPLLWLHVRSLSEGFGHFRLTFASSYPSEKFSLEADRTEVLAELDAPRAGARRPDDRLRRIAVEFWKDPARVKKALGLFAGERRRQTAFLEAEP